MQFRCIKLCIHMQGIGSQACDDIRKLKICIKRVRTLGTCGQTVKHSKLTPQKLSLWNKSMHAYTTNTTGLVG